MPKSQFTMTSPLGPLWVIVEDGQVLSLQVQKENGSFVEDQTNRKCFVKVQTQLQEYFEGRRKTFELPLKWQGTEFQIQVWQQLLHVPYASTCFYSDLARQIRNPKALRAVGSAVGKNPFLIVVPCHRVLPRSGGLGGFSAGPALKEKLLKIENIRLSKS